MAIEWVQIGDCKLACADCRDVLSEIAPGSVDAVVTDPPYGVGLASGWDGLHGDCVIDGDASEEARDAMLSLVGNTPFIVFGSWKVRRPEGTKSVLIWDKGGHSGMGDLSFPWKPNFEEIYVRGSVFRGARTSSVLSFWIHPTFNAERVHPTEKPLGLIRELVGKCPHGTILDPFMGSGTTGVACVQTGRKFIGIENDPKHFATACKRIRQAVELAKCDMFKAEKPQPAKQHELFEVTSG